MATTSKKTGTSGAFGPSLVLGNLLSAATAAAKAVSKSTSSGSTSKTTASSTTGTSTGSRTNTSGNRASTGAASNAGTSAATKSSVSSTSSTAPAATGRTYRVEASGSAPSGLGVGDEVVTGGGTYRITGVKADGSYQSIKVSDATTANYNGSYATPQSVQSASKTSGAAPSSTTSYASGKTYRVEQGGSAPRGLGVGDEVVTGGGTYRITAVNADGSYQSTKVSEVNTATYQGSYADVPTASYYANTDLGTVLQAIASDPTLLTTPEGIAQAEQLLAARAEKAEQSGLTQYQNDTTQTLLSLQLALAKAQLAQNDKTAQQNADALAAQQARYQALIAQGTDAQTQAARALSDELAAQKSAYQNMLTQNTTAAQQNADALAATLAQTKAQYEALIAQAKQNELDAAEATVQRYAQMLPGINQSYDEAAREAYVRYRTALRDLPAQLAAVGLSGQGVAESSLVQQGIAYQNTQAQNERARQARLQEIADAQQNAYAQAQTAGAKAAYQLALEAENARQSGVQAQNEQRELAQQQALSIAMQAENARQALATRGLDNADSGAQRAIELALEAEQAYQNTAYRQQQLALEKSKLASDNALAAAGLTGYYNGTQTLAARNASMNAQATAAQYEQAAYQLAYQQQQDAAKAAAAQQTAAQNAAQQAAAQQYERALALWQGLGTAGATAEIAAILGIPVGTVYKAGTYNPKYH